MHHAMRSTLRSGSLLIYSATCISRFMPGFSEDRGGYSVDVRYNGRKTNLHVLWNPGLVELEEGTATEVAAPMEKAVTDGERQAVAEWNT